jgi:hypothetical protein
MQGCDQLTGQSASIKALEQKVAELENQQHAAAMLAIDVQSRIHEMSADSPAEVNCRDDGYYLTKTSQGFLFAVSCEDVTPYLNGVRVRLEIGNPYLATFEQTDYRVTFDRQPGSGATPTGTATGKIIGNLKPGAWTHWVLVLDDVKPENLGVLKIDLRPRQIQLLTQVSQ